MVTALLALALLQGEAPQLSVSVDQDHVAIGETIVFTIEAVSRSAEPVQLTMPPIDGLQIVSRVERTEMSSIDGPTSTTVTELHLRAVREGRWRLGPVRARQGRHTVEAGALMVQVDPDRTAAVVTLSPRIRRLLERAPPPPHGKPAVSLVTSTARARVGEQVDVLTAAWFPRDLRLQLLQPPTLQTPVVEGVWTAPQTTPVAVAATRTIGGVVYDLFVAHQAIFPLVAGTVTVPAATLKFALPPTLRFLGREERYALQSRPVMFRVEPLPAEGRPLAFSGAVGSRLRLERRIATPTARVGQAVAVEYVLTGEGNTALWPAPDVRWPDGARAYTERVEEKVTTADARLGGSKVFRSLVVPDSVGVLRLPGMRYPYFDLAANRYLDASVEPATVAVTTADEVSATAALPPALMTPGAPALSWQVAHGIPAWVWLLLLALPPFAVVGRARFSPRWARRAAPVSAPPTDSLAAAETRLEHAIAAVLPEPAQRADRALEPALRAAGVEADVIRRVLAARTQMLAARYAPNGGASDAMLVSEADELARQLDRAQPRWRQDITISLLIAALLGAGAPGHGVAQTPAAEQLYASGALNAAADGFAARIATEPAVAAHWYGLGAAYYRLGDKGQATAAWLRARRLDPRDGTIRRALQLTPPADPVTARWTWVPPVRPDELLLIGIGGWVLGWLAWVARPRRRDRWTIVLLFSGAAVIAGLALRSWYARPVAVARQGAELRVSPHGRATALAKVDVGGAVLVLQQRPGWAFVRTADRRDGWLPTGAIAAVSEYIPAR